MAGTGINFAEQTGIYRRKVKRKALMKSTMISLVLLVITLIALLAVHLYKSKQERNLKQVNEQIAQERKRDYNEIAEILDVSSRLNFVGEISVKQKVWSAFLYEIERKFLTSNYLDSLTAFSKYEIELNNDPMSTETQNMTILGIDEKERIELGFVSPNLTDISKQVVAFESSDKIDSVNIGEISLDEKGLSYIMKVNLVEGGLERGSYDMEALEEQENQTEAGTEAGAEAGSETTTGSTNTNI